MIISTVYIRFFRSFNYDYLRKSHPEAKPRGPWEKLDKDLWYPFVEVGLQDDITTAVGANEAGKSQLLDAIKFALTGKGIAERDFCRYSQFFVVDEKPRHPDFGLRLGRLSLEERKAVGAACGTASMKDDEFRLFRFDNQGPVIFLRDGAKGFTRHQVRDEGALAQVLPQIFEIDSDVPLPGSVPISYLVDGQVPSYVKPGSRHAVLRALEQRASDWFASESSVTEAASDIIAALAPKGHEDSQEREFALARDLLMTVADVNRGAFVLLQQALERGDEGQAHGLINRINAQLANHLNFPKYWSQDKDFALRVSLRSLDLVFTISDRTGTEYSFKERSQGLRYFLSYFVQSLAHRSERRAGSEVMLMDEPDAYLSSNGQQDLLRIFQDHAHPADGRAASQVVYVTHSPFLIDKNHSERIRVLDKGQGEEGTRVVANAARNRYEPLRSAFGSFVGETAFISNCNLMLEGMSDQVLLAGVSALLQRAPAAATEYLDLNHVTLVPASGASQVAYMAYLALGRDADRPAVIALLDSDSAGNKARADLAKGPGGKPVLRKEFILQVGDLSDVIESARPGGPQEIEDLLPPALVLRGAQRYVKDLLSPSEHAQVKELQAEDLELGDGVGLHAAAEALLQQSIGSSFHLDKFGLARSVIDVLSDGEADDQRPVLERNFRPLFARLNKLKRDAEVEALRRRVGSRLKRTRESFFMDHPNGATREEGTLLLDEFDRQVDDSPLADDWRSDLRRVRREFRLVDDLLAPIDDYSGFRTAVERLATFEEQRTAAWVAPETQVAPPSEAAPEEVAASSSDSRQTGRRADTSTAARRRTAKGATAQPTA